MAETFVDCPNDECDDKGRHCSVNIQNAVWHCVKCGEGGSLLIPGTGALHHSICKQVLWFDEFKAQRLWLQGRYQLDDDSIHKYSIGFDTRYFRWPIYNEAGDLTGSQRQNPNPGPEDWRWRLSLGSIQSIWPADWVDIVPGQEVVLCEGLGDCTILRSCGFFAFTSTGGANTFPKQWGKIFTGSNVTILYDNDKDGIKGARKAAKYISEAGAASTHIVRWPDLFPEKSDVQSVSALHPADYKRVLEGLVETAIRYEARVMDLLPEVVTVEPPVLAEFDLTQLLTESGYLKDYHAVVRRATDAPDAFLIYPPLLAISVAIGRKVRIPYAQGIYCNLFMLLLAESTWQRKSTALDFVRAIVSRIAPNDPRQESAVGSDIADIVPPSLPRFANLVLPHEITPEALYDRLQSQPEGVMLVPEMATQIVRWKKDYQSDMPFLMSELYDCPDQITRQTRKTVFNIRYPYVCIGGGVVLHWFRRNFEFQHIISGWIPRWLLITSAQKTEFKEWPDQVDYTKIQGLANRLRDLRNGLPSDLANPADVDGSKIMGPYILWARTIRNESMARHTGDLAPMSAIWGRGLTYALKIATLLELANSGSLKISTDSWERARRLTEYALQSAEFVLMEQRAQQGATVESWVLRRIRNKPGIILRLINKGPGAQRHGGGEGIRGALKQLLEQGLIKELADERGTIHYFDINAELLPGEEKTNAE